MSRERPLTHERPHTRNPRDPRKVPARSSPHTSPKSNGNNHAKKPEREGGDIDKRVKAGVAGTTKSSSSFPSLPMSLNGWGVQGGPDGTTRGTKGLGMISMTKPKEILVEGLLR